MFEGGPFNPKGMSLIVQSSAYDYFSLVILKYRLLGDLKGGRVLTIVFFPPLKCGVNPQP